MFDMKNDFLIYKYIKIYSSINKIK